MYNPYQWKKNIDVQREDLNLKRVVNKNVERVVSTEKRPRPDLVDHFHWVIMRFRRQKKLTQEQLAKEISEPLDSIMKAEQGVLPDKDYILVRKLENALGIRLLKDEVARMQAPIEAPVSKPILKVLKFEPSTTKELTIADLRRIKERKEFELPELEEDVEDEEFEDGESADK